MLQRSDPYNFPAFPRMKPSRTLTAVAYTGRVAVALALLFPVMVLLGADPAVFGSYGTFAAVAIGAMGAGAPSVGARHWGARERGAPAAIEPGAPPVRTTSESTA